MWIFTPQGFFSVVADRGSERRLVVRARVRRDLDRLRAGVLPRLGPIREGAGTDYPYRASTARTDFGRALIKIVDETDYFNFKQRIGETLGPDRAALYGEIWSVLLDAEQVLVGSE